MLRVDYYRSLGYATLAPLVLIAISIALIKLANWYLGKKQFGIQPVIVIVAFFTFPSASSKLATIFVCQHFEYEGESYLRMDYSIRCGGPTYISWRAYAIVMIGVWVVGTPVLFFYLVYRHRRAILNNEDRLLDPKLHGSKLLWIPYTRKLWYWEAVEASRKILLSFAMQIFKPGSVIQPAYCVLITLLFLKVRQRIVSSSYCSSSRRAKSAGRSSRPQTISSTKRSRVYSSCSSSPTFS